MSVSEIAVNDSAGLFTEDRVEVQREAVLRPKVGKYSTLLRSGVGRSAVALIDQVLISGANFLFLVVVARSVAASETGCYVLALRAADFVTEIQNVFLWAPYTLFAPELKDRDRKIYAGSVLIHQAAACVLTLAICAIIAWVGYMFKADSIAIVALWAMVASLGVHLREFTRRMCFANLDQSAVLAMDCGSLILQVIGLALLYTTNRLSGWNVLLVTSIVSGVSSMACLTLLRHRFSFSQQDVLASFRKNFSYGRWLLGSDLALLISNQIYPWWLSFLSGAATVASFAASQAVTNFARMFLISAQNVLLPSSARACATGNMENVRHMVRRSTLVLAGGASLFSLFCLAAGNPLLHTIYGNKLDSHGTLVFIFSLSILATAIGLAPTFALAAARRADANLRINAITLAFHGIVGLALARFYGAAGAAYGLALGGFLAAALRWRIYNKVLGNGKATPTCP